MFFLNTPPDPLSLGDHGCTFPHRRPRFLGFHIDEIGECALFFIWCLSLVVDILRFDILRFASIHSSVLFAAGRHSTAGTYLLSPIHSPADGRWRCSQFGELQTKVLRACGRKCLNGHRLSLLSGRDRGAPRRGGGYRDPAQQFLERLYEGPLVPYDFWLFTHGLGCLPLEASRSTLPLPHPPTQSP